MSDLEDAHAVFTASEAAFAAKEREAQVEALKSEGNRLMMSGSAIGVASVAGAVLLGATCPLCVVGVPALIGFGLYQRIRGEFLHRAPSSEVRDGGDAHSAERPGPA